MREGSTIRCMPIDQNDQRLMDLMANIAAQDASSAGALKQLYDLTSSRMFGLALRVTGNREWAEDALQEAYLNIWRIAGDYRAGISPPMAWMGVIVRSRSLDFLRRRNSERADSALELDDYLQDTIAGEGDDPLDMAEASQQAVALRQCLSRLEVRQREVISLAYLRELSHSELAEQLKLPLGTVKTWIRRGLTQLRDCLGRLAS